MSVLLLLFGTLAEAAFPERPIRIIVSFPAGNTSDALVRIIAERAARDLGQPVIIENKPGAAGQIAMAALKTAMADGYTIGMISAGAAMLAALDPRLPYDIEKDYRPIAGVSYVFGGLLVHPSVAEGGMKGFIAYLKANPGKVNYGSGGNGSATHLLMERFAAKAGVTLTHVPYVAEARLIQDLLAGTIQATFTASPYNGFVSQGRLAVLATVGGERWFAHPNAPTLVEAGFDLTQVTWQGMFAPQGVPEPNVQVLANAFIKAARDPDTRRRLMEIGVVPGGVGADELARYLRESLQSYREMVRQFNLKPG